MLGAPDKKWTPGPEATDKERAAYAAEVESQAKNGSVFMIVVIFLIALGVGAVTMTIGFWVIVGIAAIHYSNKSENEE